MTLHLHALRGCGATPLAHYLKALGVFRLVCEQKDPDARAFWRDEVFHLVTTLDSDELVRFICDEFTLTPFIAPWNGGSGFYPKDAKDGIALIEASSADRFRPYREAIALARSQVDGRAERPEKDEKAAFLAACARSWDEEALRWFGAAVGLSTEGVGRYPALLGTGGNDGRLEFTNNVMQRLGEILDLHSGRALERARPLAHSALFGEAVRGLESAAVGQFLPGGAGGANSGAGFDGQSQLNPWDFVLMLEGTIALRVASLRRLDGRELPQAAAPYAIRALPVSYASAAATDDEGGRGEQWLPLWDGPTRFSELATVFAEARMVRGAKRTEGALDAARAISQQGVARGIRSFVRFAFIVRNGLSNLAVPLAQVRVASVAGVRLLDQLDDWMERLGWAARDKHAPASFGVALGRIQGAMFDIATGNGGPVRFGALLAQLGAAEDLFVRSGRFTAERGLRPLPRLTSEWVAAADDGSPEFRLAASLASAHAPGTDVDDPIRAHCLPLDASKRYRRFASGGDGLRHDPRVVWKGHDLVSDLGAVVLRRAVEAETHGIPLWGTTFASLDDISAFVSGDVNDVRIADLARGLMAVEPSPNDPGPARALPLYALFRAACLDGSALTLRALKGMRPRVDVQTLRLLSAGRLADAGRIARSRLVAMGLRPKLGEVIGDARIAQRILASIAFPISPHAVGHVLAAVVQPYETTTMENS